MLYYSSTDDKLMNALQTIDQEFPYYIPFVTYCRFVPTKTIQTISITPSLKLEYNEPFISLLTKEELIFVLLHEFSHIIYNHHNRFLPYRDKYTHDSLNNMADLEINSFLDKKVCPGNHKVTRLKQGLFPEMFQLPELKTMEEYLEIMENSGRVQNISNPMGNDCKGEDGSSMSNGGDNLTEEQLSKLLDECEESAKTRGSKSFLNSKQLLKPKKIPYDWSKILENTITDLYKTITGYDYYTYSKISRRSASYNDIIIPTYYSLDVDVSITIIFDVSSSMYNIKNRVFGLLISLQEVFGTDSLKFRILETDTKVLRDREDITVCESEPINIINGDGTDMCVGWDYIKDNKINTDLIICLTDGYTGYPSPEIFKEKSVILWTTQEPTNTTYKNYHVKI